MYSSDPEARLHSWTRVSTGAGALSSALWIGVVLALLEQKVILRPQPSPSFSKYCCCADRRIAKDPKFPAHKTQTSKVALARENPWYQLAKRDRKSQRCDVLLTSRI